MSNATSSTRAIGSATEVVAARQRLLGLMLLVVEAFALGFLSETIAYPGFIVLTATAAWFFRYRWKLSNDQMVVVYVLMIPAFGLKFILADDNPNYSWGFLNFQGMLVVAQYFFTTQWIHLLRDTKDDRLPYVFPTLGVVVMVSIAVVRVSSIEVGYFQAACALFIFIATLFYDACAKPSKGLVAANAPGSFVYTSLAFGSLALAVAAAWFGTNAFFRFERQMDQFVMRFLQPQGSQEGMSFEGDARLGSLAQHKQRDREKVAMRIYSKTEPGYMRGRVFDRFSRSAWGSNSSLASLDPLAEFPNNLSPPDEEKLFSARNMEAKTWQSLECWPAQSLRNRMLATLGTTHISARVNEVSVDQHQVFESDELLPMHPYRTWVPRGTRQGKQNQPLAAQQPISEFRRVQLTTLPDEVPPIARRLADRLFVNCKTPQEKINAVTSYFHQNYRYNLGIIVPQGTDPLEFFLKEKPPAHCEYFACATAVLLRLGKVPARYVTGFVSKEHNELGDFWVARHKDAHAWVEAYDETTGWVTVEATPSVGVPEERTTSNAGQLWDVIKERYARLRVAWQQGGLKSIGRSLLQFLLTPVGIVVLAVLLTAVILYLRGQRTPAEKAKPVAERVIALNELLTQLDKELRRQRLERDQHETLFQFADRISLPAVSDWYRNYASIRYQPTVTEEAMTRLSESLTQAIDSIRAKA
ncbi:MAG: hypothetical protein CMJ78_08960 [Planctomycetaceae bacterium]|nr:hypothetical protein [Planctomycetaceae bacterium]